MNYEEMLNSQEGVAQHIGQTPLGMFYKKLKDGKYRNVIDLKPELTDSLVFCDSLRRDQQAAPTIDSPRQLKYELHEDSGGIYELELQPGNFLTLAQMLDSTPYVVAQKGFIADTINDLFDYAEALHERGIYQLCFAPQTIFVRKGDTTPLMLCHGSSFLGMKDQATFYRGFEDYVAPEVLENGVADERSDVYALARFLQMLFDKSSMPYEYRGVIKKATAASPDSRYASVREMRQAVNSKRSTRRSLIMLIAACVVAALAVWLYFDLVPQSSNVEFVDSPKTEDPFAKEYDDPMVNDQDEYLDPDIVAYMDSIGLDDMTDQEFHDMADSVKNLMKVEEIFRKRFQRMADSKLSTLYSTPSMTGTEADFIGKSQKTIDELMDYATKLGEETGLPPDVASSMASQIITEIQVKNREDNTNVNSTLKSQE
jgi:hypothetical protein